MARPQLGRTPYRMLAVLIALLLLVVLFVVRLVDIQLVNAAELNEQAKDKRQSPSVIRAVRGQITDDQGTVLAESVNRYRITVDQNNVGDFTRETDSGAEVTVTVEQAAKELASATGEYAADILTRLTGTKKYSVVATDLDVDAYERVLDIGAPWIYSEIVQQRYYPSGAVAGNLLGYVSSEGEAQDGIERIADSCLAGEDGEETYERSMLGARIPGSTVVTKQAVQGGTVKTTINRDLQWFAQQKIAERVEEQDAKWGAIVIMKKNGDLVAVAEAPSLDPNDVGATDQEDRGSRVFRSSLEPGSTFKSVTASALIDSGAATPTTQVDAPYRITMGKGSTFKDAVSHPTYHLTLAGVLRYSSNTGIVQLGDKLDDQTRFDYISKFGIGQKTAVDFPGEATGIVPDVDSMALSTHYTTMFGQGIAATPIQMMGVYQTLANGGERVSPRLIESCTSEDGTVTENAQADPVRVISEQSADTMVGMLQNAVRKGGATYAQISGYQVAGKTGTAQIAKEDGSGYKSGSYYTSFIGIAPADDPQYIVGVFLYDAKKNHTSSNATDVFSNVMTQVLKTYQVEPSGKDPVEYEIEYK